MEAINLYGSICLTDIPKELITTGKNGKKYINIEVRERQQVGRYGDTHYIKAACRKEQQVEGVKYFIGDLKPSKFGGQVQQTQGQAYTPPEVPIDELF